MKLQINTWIVGYIHISVAELALQQVFRQTTKSQTPPLQTRSKLSAFHFIALLITRHIGPSTSITYIIAGEFGSTPPP